MSQPYDRKAAVPTPGKLDPTLNEFWSENPWHIIAHGHNLSCFERNRLWMNVGGQGFVDLSHLTSADSDGDGRAVVGGDFRNIGKIDLLVRQSGGGAFLYFENNFATRHYLKVSLRGKVDEAAQKAGKPTSNRQGVGARLVARVNGHDIVREVFPANSYVSQAPLVAHFGLGEATQVERLTIRWPSGNEQILSNLAADQHVLVSEGKEGSSAVEVVIPGRVVAP